MTNLRPHFDQTYNNFFQILAYFLEGGYLEESEDETIKRFCSVRDKDRIEKAIKEGKEVLKLEPFPWEWISDTAHIFLDQIKRITKNRKFTKEEENNSEDVKEWTKWVIKALEVLRWQSLEIFDDRCLRVVRRCLRSTNTISFIDKFFER